MQYIPQVVKFFEEQTIQTTERRFEEELEVPQVVFCTKFPFKTDMMTEMGFREKFLLVKPHTYLENKNITDLNDVWENGTYSMDELSIGWLVMYGKCNQL